MGVMKMFSSSSADKSVSIFSHWKNDNMQARIDNQKFLPNPRADNYKIIRYEEFDNSFIIEIQYLDCINFEGRKILYFEDYTLEQLKKQKLIDPHFSENKKFISPKARFEPTKFGWKDARMFALYKKQWKSKT